MVEMAPNNYSNGYDTEKKYTCYVTALDKFMSGWGGCEGRKSKFVVACDNWAQANTIKQNLSKERNFSYISIHQVLPKYPVSKYHTHYTTFSECRAYNH